MILSRLQKICNGILLGLVMSLLLFVIIFEHESWFFILPIFPFFGAIIGAFLGFFSKKSPTKFGAILAIFTTFFLLSLMIMKGKDLIFQTRREAIGMAIAQLPKNSQPEIIGYKKGNGMEYPPEVELLINNGMTATEASSYYYDFFVDQGWSDLSLKSSVPGKWQNGKISVYLRDDDKNDKGKYTLRIDFYQNGWLYFYPSFSPL